jgi:hypothetical protein
MEIAVRIAHGRMTRLPYDSIFQWLSRYGFLVMLTAVLTARMSGMTCSKMEIAVN